MQTELFSPNELHAGTLLGECRRYLEAIYAPQTRIGYSQDLKIFSQWCSQHHRLSLPASTETVLLFLTEQLETGHKVSTARRRYHAIAYEHKRHGFTGWAMPEARLVLLGAQRMKAEQLRQVAPVTIPDLRAIAGRLAESSGARAIRDHAILLLGFASALRSANLASLTLEDVEFVREGLVLKIRQEKNNRDARARYLGVPWGKHPETCAPGAVARWLDVRQKAGTHGLFLGWNKTGRAAPMAATTVCQIVKRLVRMIGLDPKKYGGHSLRSGFVTAAGEAGVTALSISQQTGHRDLNSVQGYFRRTSVFAANCCSSLDL